MKLRFLCTPLNKTASLVESLRPCRRVHPSTLRRFSGVPGAASRVHAEMAKIISIVNADQVRCRAESKSGRPRSTSIAYEYP